MNMITHRVSPQQARYTPMGGREKCAWCRFYIAPKWCGHVTGPVSPMGWCKFFSQEMRQQFGGSQVVAIGPPGATLDLGFMTPGTLDSRISSTRASPATYTDAAGTIQPAAIDQPRWDYANGVLRGLLIEEARTNLLLNSATLGTQGVVVTAQAYTLSFTGTGTITKSGAATGALVGTGATQRVSQTFTPTAGTVTCTVTGSVTNAQLEAGPFVTSYIPTTAAAVTRAQDLPSIATSPWMTPGVGTWLAEFILFGNVSFIGVIAANANGGVAPLETIGSNQICSYDGSNVVQTANAWTANAITKASSSFGAGTGKVCLNGGPIASGTQTGFFMNPIGFIEPVSGASGNNGSGYLRRVQYWPRALSDSEMQQVTT